MFTECHGTSPQIPTENKRVTNQKQTICPRRVIGSKFVVVVGFCEISYLGEAIILESALCANKAAAMYLGT